MPFNREIHHRRSIRLRNYDYSQNGLYYVTICVNKKLELFGEISENKMKLNEPGKMISDLWMELPEKYSSVFLDEYIVMPNHFHGIIGIDDSVEATDNDINWGRHTGLPLQRNPESGVGVDLCVNPNMELFKINGLPRFIRWFKTQATNKYIHGVDEKEWEPFYRKLWQRNYYEYVIRNEKDLENIRRYIRFNPINWDDDEDNPLNI